MFQSDSGIIRHVESAITSPFSSGEQSQGQKSSPSGEPWKMIEPLNFLLDRAKTFIFLKATVVDQ